MTKVHSRPYWFRRHPGVTLTMVVIVGVVLSLTFGELASRIAFPGWAPTRAERSQFWAYDDMLGWSHRPNQEGQFSHPDFSVHVQINAQGLRDREYPLERTEKKRVLVLGDSYGWGFGVEHHERFDEVLEIRNPDWEIINASVSGYGTDQQLLYLRGKGIALQPDVVLVLFCRNDPTNNSANRQYWHSKPYFALNAGELELHNVPVPERTLLQEAKLLLLGRTYLFRRLLMSQRLLLERLETKLIDGEEYTQGQLASDLGITEQLIRELRDVSEENGASLILVGVPGAVPLDAMHDALTRLSANLGIPYLALDKHFEKAAKQTNLTFPRDSHWNASGHAVAADRIEPFLEELAPFPNED